MATMTFIECLKDAQANAQGDVDVLAYRDNGDEGAPHAVFNEIYGIEFHGTFYPSDLLEAIDWAWVEV